MYPTDVEVNEEKILKLTKTLKKAYKEIVSEIENATDFGVYNRGVILAQIDRRLTELGVDIDAFIREELPEYYKRGADDAIKQLRKQGVPLETTYGFNRVHIEAIEALIDDTAKAFGESLSGVSRSANNLLGKATRELITQQIAKGMIAGEALQTTKKMIKGILKEQGLDALVDKGGHKWTLDRYSEMLLRTKAVEARNRGLINRVAENGYDLVQVSHHFTDCDLCRPWEGKIISIGGATKGYPTLAQAEEQGLFHPNCKHAINTLIPKLATMTYAYDDQTKTYVLPQSVAVDMAKESGGARATDLKFGKFNGRLQPWEKKFADKYELEWKTEFLGKTTRGQYQVIEGDITKRSITINEKILSAVVEELQGRYFNWTLKHEIGHFLDQVFGLEQGKSYTFFSRVSSEWQSAVYSRVKTKNLMGEEVSFSEAKIIARRRLLAGVKDYDSTYWDKLTNEERERYLSGEQFNIGDPFKDAKGRTVQKVFGLSRKYLNYVTSSEEVFAEAYSWYENDPEGLKKAAPNTFEVVKNLIEMLK